MTAVVSNVTEHTAQAVHGDSSADVVDYDLLVAKLLALIVLSHGPFLLVAAPLKLVKTVRSFSPSSGGRRPQIGPVTAAGSRAATQLLRFGGGALLCAALLRVQPEVRDRVATLQHDGRLPGTEHLGDALLCLGFFALCIGDELAHVALPGRRPGGSVAEDVLRRALSLRLRPVFAPLAPKRAGPRPIAGARARRERYRQTESEGAERRRSPVTSETAGGAGDLPPPSLRRGLFTVLALSGHEVFEGMAIGLEARADHAWCLFLAVATRKLVVACCVGLELAWSETHRSALIAYAVAFAAVTPVGIVAGMVITHHCDGPVAVVLQGLTAGTLLYVAFSEVLPPQKSARSHLLYVVIGFGVLLLL